MREGSSPKKGQQRMTDSIIELHTQVPADLEGNVFGQFDEHLKLIERTLNVTLISRDGMLKILGTDGSATQAKKLIEELVTLAGRGNTITRQNVTYALSLAMEARNQVLTEIDKDFICNTIQGRPIKPKTLGQKEYVEQIRKKMIVFGIGPAGTGKTYLAMAMAVTAFRNEEVSRSGVLFILTVLALLPACMIGGLLAYLRLNWHPAKAFMGDTGSLFMGGIVCGLAFALDIPLVLILAGFVYIVETLSVILQVTYFKATHGKRLFKMSPIHHHFEMSGWKEEKIVLTFAAVSAVMCLIAWFSISGLTH